MCASAIFAGQDRIVAGYVRLRIVGAVLELDVHPEAKLLEVETAPVDSDLLADAPGLLARGPRSGAALLAGSWA